MNLRREESKKLYFEFSNAVKLACSMSYIRVLVEKQNKLKQVCDRTKQLDCVINLLLKDNGNKDQNLLGAALLAEMVFIEDFIKNELGYSLLPTGENVALCTRNNEQIELTGHMFFKREDINGFKTVVDVSEFNNDIREVPSKWCNVSNSDVTLISSVLLKEYDFPHDVVQKYVHNKYIRNTQIAHAGDNIRVQLTSADVVDFYNSLIYPLLEKRFNLPHYEH